MNNVGSVKLAIFLRLINYKPNLVDEIAQNNDVLRTKSFVVDKFNYKSQLNKNKNLIHLASLSPNKPLRLTPNFLLEKQDNKKEEDNRLREEKKEEIQEIEISEDEKEEEENDEELSESKISIPKSASTIQTPIVQKRPKSVFKIPQAEFKIEINPPVPVKKEEIEPKIEEKPEVKIETKEEPVNVNQPKNPLRLPANRVYQRLKLNRWYKYYANRIGSDRIKI